MQDIPECESCGQSLVTLDDGSAIVDKLSVDADLIRSGALNPSRSGSEEDTRVDVDADMVPATITCENCGTEKEVYLSQRPKGIAIRWQE